MKLLTKEWYQTMQDSGLGVQLVADDRAADASEEVFRALWDEKLDEWMEQRAELEDEFDEGRERRLFREGYLRDLENFRTRTPKKIIQKVADIRVLALGYCTAEVWRDLREYRNWCRKWTEMTLEEAFNMRSSQGLDEIWTGTHSLHDSVVLSLSREGEDLLINFERDEDTTWPEIKGIRFRNAVILKHEKPLEGAFWLYDEIWRTEEGGYEIHALLWRNNEVFDLAIGCRDTELIWTVQPKVAF